MTKHKKIKSRKKAITEREALIEILSSTNIEIHSSTNDYTPTKQPTKQYRFLMLLLSDGGKTPYNNGSPYWNQAPGDDGWFLNKDIKKIVGLSDQMVIRIPKSGGEPEIPSHMHYFKILKNLLNIKQVSYHDKGHKTKPKETAIRLKIDKDTFLNLWLAFIEAGRIRDFMNSDYFNRLIKLPTHNLWVTNYYNALFSSQINQVSKLSEERKNAIIAGTQKAKEEIIEMIKSTSKNKEEADSRLKTFLSGISLPYYSVHLYSLIHAVPWLFSLFYEDRPKFDIMIIEIKGLFDDEEQMMHYLRSMGFFGEYMDYMRTIREMRTIGEIREAYQGQVEKGENLRKDYFKDIFHNNLLKKPKRRL